MPKFTANAVVVANTILLLPNAIDLELVLLELNVPVVSVNPFSARLPLVNVVAAVAPRVNASPNVVVPDTLSIVSASMGLALLVIVPVPTMFKVSAVNVPPVDKVRLPSMFNVVAASANAVDPKLRLLNQLPVVRVTIATPVPVNDKLGALVLEPPVVPNTQVLVTEASVVNPPVPVYVNPVAMAILKTVCAAVVCDRIILFEPNAIDRVLALVELKIPVVKLNPPRSSVPAVSVVVLVATREGLSPSVSVPPARLKPMPPNCLLN